MSAIFTVRNTAFGAGALAVLAVLATDRSGLGQVVDPDAAPSEAGAPAAQIVAHPAAAKPAPAGNAWYAISADEEPQTFAAPAAAAPMAAAVPPNAVRPPEPTGPDFPPGLKQHF